MNKAIITLIIAILILFGICKTIIFMKRIELNTASPQTSGSIVESKKNNFLRATYILDSITSINKIDIKEAWIEDVWKNSYIKDKQLKENLGGIQLVVNTRDFFRYGFDDSSFLNGWDITLDKEVLQGGGKGSGLYVFYLKGSIPPDRMKLTLSNKNAHTSEQKKVSFELIHNHWSKRPASSCPYASVSLAK